MKNVFVINDPHPECFMGVRPDRQTQTRNEFDDSEKLETPSLHLSPQEPVSIPAGNVVNVNSEFAGLELPPVRIQW